MSCKPRPNRAEYLRVLRQMTPNERLLKAMELTETARQLFMDGLRRRFPDVPDDQRKHIYLERLKKCHNRNY